MDNVALENSGGGNHELELSLGRLNITSGNRTYRIASPTRQHPHATVLNNNSFQGLEVRVVQTTYFRDTFSNTYPPPLLQDPQDDMNEKGFYISFDNEQPKRPKPPLRTKRSPKKEKGAMDNDKITNARSSLDNSMGKMEPQQIQHHHELDEPPIAPKRMSAAHAERQQLKQQQQMHHEPLHYHHNSSNPITATMPKETKAIIIDSEMNDPVSISDVSATLLST